MIFHRIALGIFIIALVGFGILTPNASILISPSLEL